VVLALGCDGLSRRHTTTDGNSRYIFAGYFAFPQYFFAVIVLHISDINVVANLLPALNQFVWKNMRVINSLLDVGDACLRYILLVWFTSSMSVVVISKLTGKRGIYKPQLLRCRVGKVLLLVPSLIDYTMHCIYQAYFSLLFTQIL